MYLVPRSSWRYAQLKNQKTTHREDTRSNRKEDKGIFLNNRKANPQKDISGTVGQPCCPLPIVLNRRMDKFRMHITRKQPTKKKKKSHWCFWLFWEKFYDYWRVGKKIYLKHIQHWLKINYILWIVEKIQKV